MAAQTHEETFVTTSFDNIGEDEIASYPTPDEFNPNYNPSTTSSGYTNSSSKSGGSSVGGKRKKRRSGTPGSGTNPWLLKAQVWCYDKVLLFQVLVLITLEPLVMKHAKPEDLKEMRRQQEEQQQQQNRS